MIARRATDVPVGRTERARRTTDGVTRTGRADRRIRACCSQGLARPWSARVRLRDDPTHSTFTFMREVKNRRRGATRISSKHQITIPADALRAAGLEIGDRVVAHADGAGRVVLEREHDILAEFAGAMTGAYTANELDDLRREWD